MTAEATHQEPTINQRIGYTRRHLPAEQREVYETALREATQQALDSGDYRALSDVIEQWYRAAFLEHHGGESWQRMKQLIQEGRWDELFPGPARDADEVIAELQR
jgi:hypothetical protein